MPFNRKHCMLEANENFSIVRIYCDNLLIADFPKRAYYSYADRVRIAKIVLKSLKES